MNSSPVGQPIPWQMNFQQAASPVMEGVQELHQLLLLVITGIALTIIVLMAYIIYRYRASKNPIPSTTTHNTVLEIIWTTIPVLILILIGIPSIRLLYKMDKPVNADITIKAIGHQWYWSYEYPDPVKIDKKFEFDSYMIEEKKLQPGQLRLLDVDNPLVVPIETTVRILVTSADVLHSFAVPSLGIKRDAVPGRINETWFRIRKPGMYYGQCSELCGIKHGFMPICIKAISKEEYDQWLYEKTGIKKSDHTQPIL